MKVFVSDDYRDVETVQPVASGLGATLATFSRDTGPPSNVGGAGRRRAEGC